MLLVITGGSGSGKSWIAEGFQKKMNPEESTVILDCVAEILETKMKENRTSEVIAMVMEDIGLLAKQTDHLIVVANEVFSDVPKRDESQKYAEYLGMIHQQLAKQADLFVEVVYGIPILLKNKSAL